MKSFSLVIPIYNEERILEKQVRALISEIDNNVPKAEYEIILVENGSIDRTYAIAKKLARHNSHIQVVKLKKPSYGQAFREGVKEAKYDIVFQFDIDFWDTDFLNLSLLLLNRYEIVIGSKNLGYSEDSRSLQRRIFSKGLEYFLKLYFGVPYSDTHGMKAFRRKLILPLIDEVSSDNHFFDSELLIRCYYLNYSFKELPVGLKEIRKTRFSFVTRATEVLFEFIQLIFLKKLLVRYSYT